MRPKERKCITKPSSVNKRLDNERKNEKERKEREINKKQKKNEDPTILPWTIKTTCGPLVLHPSQRKGGRASLHLNVGDYWLFIIYLSTLVVFLLFLFFFFFYGFVSRLIQEQSKFFFFLFFSCFLALFFVLGRFLSYLNVSLSFFFFFFLKLLVLEWECLLVIGTLISTKNKS